MQYLLHPKLAESFLQTIETVERWGCDVKMGVAVDIYLSV